MCDECGFEHEEPENSAMTIKEEVASCTCSQLDDDLIESGYTCYYCYQYNKDNPDN
jgi:hypothetical protein